MGIINYLKVNIEFRKIKYYQSLIEAFTNGGLVKDNDNLESSKVGVIYPKINESISFIRNSGIFICEGE